DISISTSANPVCQGALVNFTSTAINGGTFPVYQWKINGINVGSNQPSYAYIPTDGDIVTCTLTSSLVCNYNNPAMSNSIVMVVNPFLSIAVDIIPSENPTCEGDSVTFSANTINGGSSPDYQWQLNGMNVGINSSDFTYIPMLNDQITCILTSSEPCTYSNPVSSIPVIMEVLSLLPVSITILASSNPVCGGIPITLTGASINGGSTPVYQWQVNGINTGTNNSVFTYTPADGDVVTCILTSNAECITNNPATSNSITMSVGESPAVMFNICFDTITTLNAEPFKLKGGIPLGGTYSGPGVDQITEYFNPAMAGFGTKQITYSYTNFFNCSNNSIQSITVVNPTSFTCGLSFTDIRDNNVYPTIQIGGQCWLAVNLNHGQQIIGSSAQRDNCFVEKYCYNDISTNCTQYGALYQWDELMRYEDTEEIQGLCPPGWHVPSESDWNQLFAVYQGSAFAGSPLLFTGYSGFNVLLTGVEFFNSSPSFADFASIMWSSTSHGPYKAWSHGLNEYNYSVSYYPSYRSNAFSVRCVKD
ncbi:MAG: hypothetical protein HQ542_01915, partial [Bacteroidia bacterium]|nr:hypothetical protein [Bacteroidia bacterium]